MVTLNDYLYSGDTIFKIIQNYMTDLRKEAKRTHNEIDLVHSNCLLQVQEMLEHNDFLTSQSQKIREFYKYMAKEFPFLAFTFRGRIKSLIRTEEKFNGYIVEYIYNYYEEHGTYPVVADLKEKLSLVRGDIHPSDLQTEEELEEELPEDYFETVCKATEEGDLGVFSITAPDGAEYLYFKPLMSHSYARILAVKDNAEALVCDQIRENSRIYPRPVPSQMFLEAPFDFDVPTLECLLQSIGRKEENKDIKFTQTSSGTIFLYSDKYLDDDLAEFLAEEQEMRPLNP